MNDPFALDDKLNECKIMKTIKHPNICSFKGYFQKDDILYILFDYCD